MEVPPVRSKARFELLDPYGNGCRSIGNKCGTFGNGSALPLQISNSIEESRINLLPESGEEADFDAQQGRKPTKTRTPKPRERNALIDALIAVDGGIPQETTSDAFKKVGVALSKIREVCPDVTNEEIKARAASYHRKHPTWTLTAMALANHWGELTGSAGKPKSHQDLLRGCA
jgi:hypothetical protein